MSPSSQPTLVGRLALITGSSRGIGAATARSLARAGAVVAINGRAVDAVDEVVNELTAAGATAIAAPGDAGDPTAMAGLRRSLEAARGPVDLLALVAGGGGAPQPITECSTQDWRSALMHNLDPVFVTLREFLPGMVERSRGAVVAVGSTAGQMPTPAGVGYATAKAGISMLIRHTASLVARHGVRLNVVSPGTVTNSTIARLPAQARERMADAVPLGRLGQPDDIAAAITFLLSDQASWITGATLDVNGGQLIR